MAPELSLGKTYSTECDVYSLGITGIELLTGVRNPAKLVGLVEIPQQLREVLLLMSHVRANYRPTIEVCRQILVSIGQTEHARRQELATKAEATRIRQMLDRQAQQDAHQARLQRARQTEARQAAGAGLSLGAFAVLVAGGIALANMNSRDGGGRWRGSDGKFRSGRWG